MAEESSVDLSGTAVVQMADHERTYQLFLGMIKYCSLAIVLVLIFLASLL
jgi:hypothetical protein